MGTSKVQHTQPAITRSGEHTAHPLPCSSSAKAGWFWFPICPPQAWPWQSFQIHLNDSSQDSWSLLCVWRKRCCTLLLLAKGVLSSGSTTMLSQKWPWGLTIAAFCKMALPSFCYNTISFWGLVSFEIQSLGWASWTKNLFSSYILFPLPESKIPLLLN